MPLAALGRTMQKSASTNKSLAQQLQEAIAAGDMGAIAAIKRQMERGDPQVKATSTGLPDFNGGKPEGFTDEEPPSPTPEPDIVDTEVEDEEVPVQGIELPEQEGDLRFKALEMAGNLGGQFLDNRAINKADKKNRQATARANMVTALTGKQQTPALRSPKRGIGHTLLSALGGAGKVGQASVAQNNAANQTGFKNEIDLAQNDRADFNAQTNRINAEKANTSQSGPKVSDLRKGAEALGQAHQQKGVRYDSPEMAETALLEHEAFKAIKVNYPDMWQSIVGAAFKANAGEFGSVSRLGQGERRLGQGDTRIEGTQRERDIDNVGDLMILKAEEIARTGTPGLAAWNQAFKESLDEVGGPDGLGSIGSALVKQKGTTAYLEKVAKINEQKAKQEAIEFTHAIRQNKEIRATKAMIEGNPWVTKFAEPLNSYAKLIASYNEAKRDTENQSGSHTAFANFFQRLIDPATVREGDIALMKDAMSTFQRWEADIARFSSGGWLASEALDGMMTVAEKVFGAQRDVAVKGVKNSLNSAPSEMLDFAYPGMSPEEIADLLFPLETIPIINKTGKEDPGTIKVSTSEFE